MKTRFAFEPQLLTVLREKISRQQIARDITSGLIVGIVALPLAIAFAIASGVQPAQGLATAVIAGFLISAFSGSRVQIGGPTGAFIVIVYGIVQRYGYDGLATATLLAGVMLILMGIFRLGAVIKYIPYPVTVGFTAGIALIIATGQARDLAGLDIAQVPSEFIHKLSVYAHSLHTANPYALLLSGLTIALMIYWPRITRKIPGSLVALLLTTALVHLMGLPVETIGGRFGEVPSSLPMPRLPNMSWQLIMEMIGPAVTIAILAGIESLLSAVVADGMTGQRHRSNTELIAQGIANIASPIFGGIPATGAIARTATNIKSGGATPIAGMVHALVLLLIMVIFGRLAALIPMATLAGILMVVAYNMSEWRLFVKLFRGPREDILVLLLTFSLTVLVDLTVAIQVGVVLAAILFMRRMAKVTEVGYARQLLGDEEREDDPKNIRGRRIPHGVEVFEINGPFFFGAADKFKDAISQVNAPPKVLILRLRRVPAIDATALIALEEVQARAAREGVTLILSGVHAQPLATLTRAGFLARVGQHHAFDDIDQALEHATLHIERRAHDQESGAPTLLQDPA
ncbi:sulfate permease [Myxococcota bacterium]|nr:sulfate permease [Myxococcota bacterium]MBU1432427.1 sulfate permease [Myxococcota bacterium]